ncbi:unnamed protein product [Brassica oleracea]
MQTVSSPLLHQHSAELVRCFHSLCSNMNQVELSSYDQAVEDEAQTVSLGSGTGAHSLQTLDDEYSCSCPELPMTLFAFQYH